LHSSMLYETLRRPRAIPFSLNCALQGVADSSGNQSQKNPLTASFSTMLQRLEPHLQESESTALTFTLNHACRGLQQQASESRNSVPV
jgi:hypothetical protein